MSTAAASSVALRDVCELFENVLGEALMARTENIHSFRLGPPDLCHIAKTSPKAIKEVTSYHHVSGVDASSPGALAAYINMLTYSVETQKGWFTSSQLYKIKSGVYCCYNAFSMLDVRVEVRIPGGVSLYAVNRQGKRVAVENASAMFWHELFVSSVLRAILDTDYPPSPAGLRRMEPLPNVNVETRFLESVKEVFMKGWQLGCEPEVQVPTNVSNILAYGLTKYYGTDAGRWDVLERLWTDLLPKDPSIAALLAQAHMGLDQDSRTVKILYRGLQQISMNPPLLTAQLDFLQKKGKKEYALTTAKRLVNAASLEFKAWARLAECYMQYNNWEMTLLTLNSCPMFTVPMRDHYPLPPPAMVHFPSLEDVDLTEYSDNDILPLAPLRAESLKGTFKQAYLLLAQMVNAAGWEELLRHRAKVFVMEDEYRQVKEKELAPYESEGGPKGDKKNTATNNPDRIVTDSKGTNKNGVHSPKDQHEDIPNSDEVVELTAHSDSATSHATSANTVDNSKNTKAENGTEISQMETVDDDTLPKLARTSPVTQSASQLISAFSHKRLCERWLDDLFLMLYEDLRVYTAWKAEESHSKTYSLAYKRTPGEWEYLGNLCMRVGKKNDAKVAYKQAADLRFSPKCLLHLLQLSSDDGEVDETLKIAGKLMSFPVGSVNILYRVYGDITYPNPIATAIFKLIRNNGLIKVQSSLVALNLSPKPFKSLARFFEYAETFKVRGWDR